MIRLTEQQSRAAYTQDRNLIVVAGAGSGKTRVLVERYLALLDANRTWSLSNLVAITFTYKAAQEMRDRVRSALQSRVASSSGDERTFWARHLATMDSARIDTIHALCASILRTNAAEAGVDPGFGIVEPLDAEVMVADVIDRVLLRLLEGDTPDPAAALFTHYDAAAIRETLAAFAHQPLIAPVPPAPELWQTWQDRRRAAGEQALLDAAQDAFFATLQRWLSTMPLPTGDKFTPYWQGLSALLSRIAQYAPGTAPEPLLDDLAAWADGLDFRYGKSSLWGGKDDFDEMKARLRQAEAWVKALLDAPGPSLTDIDREAAELLPLWGALVRRVQLGYRAVKRDNDLLDFDDLEEQTAALLRQSADVRARYVGQAFKHVLVDEFQDTNSRQWEIVQALTDPDHQPDDEPARLFVVGDPKQSIYGFRGADVSVFEQVRAHVGGLPTGEEVPLSRSFRTHTPLIDAFNHIFERVLVRDMSSPVAAYQVTYHTPLDAAREQPPHAGPTLELLLIDTRGRDDSGAYIVNERGTASERISADEARTWEAAEIAAWLRRVVEDEQRPIFDKEAGETRPVDYSDIALLFQTTTNVPLYEAALRAAGIDYVTVAGRGYYSRQEVWDLLALLEFLHNADDHLALATALRSPLFSLSDEALFALRIRRDADDHLYPLWDELQYAASHDDHPYLPAQDRPAVEAAARLLRHLRGMAGRVTIFELLREVLAQTGYLAALSGLPDGPRRRANVEKLLNKALDSGRVTLSAFTQYLSDLSEREVRESEAETEISRAVTLMTVHASKGLEFPVVLLPDASWHNRGGWAEPLRVDPQGELACIVIDENGERQQPHAYARLMEREKQLSEAEHKRLLYVAATRAQDMLLISGQAYQKKDGWSASGWLQWLLDALDVQTAAFDAPEDTLDYPWGTVRLHHPLWPPDAAQAAPDDDGAARSLWGHTAVLNGQPLSDVVEPPPLTAPVPVERDRFARNLTATQIADLGGALHDPYYLERFKRSVLHQGPGHVSRALPPPRQTKARVSPRILGEIVHEALRWWRFPSSKTDMEAELSSYAWQHGVVLPDDIAYAVSMARGWLREMRYTAIYRQVEASPQVYRELPFVYQTEKRVIHGVIDLLFQRTDGAWVLVDYKSSMVPGYQENNEAAERANQQLMQTHAKRYHLQVGVYAAAVLQYLRSIHIPVERDQLSVYILYLRYGEHVTVAYDEWNAALNTLETQIGTLIEEDDEDE